MEIIEKRLDEIRPYERNPRRNDAAVQYVAESIRQFGWKQPIVIDKDGVIVAGHTRYKAAQSLGFEKAPCVIADDLTPEQVRAYRLADNKVGEIAGWDFDALEEELDALDLDMSAFGFEAESQPEFEETELDDGTTKERVVVSINIETVALYRKIESRINAIAEEINATVAVKMA